MILPYLVCTDGVRCRGFMIDFEVFGFSDDFW